MYCSEKVKEISKEKMINIILDFINDFNSENNINEYYYYYENGKFYLTYKDYYD